jgi:hypothetical protein
MSAFSLAAAPREKAFAPDSMRAATLPYQREEADLFTLQSFGMPLRSPIIFGAETLDESAITHCLNGGCL